MTYRVIPDPEVSGAKWVPGLESELRPSRLPPVPDFYWLSTLIAFPTTFRTPVPE